GRVHEHLGAVDERAGALLVADVAAQLLDPGLQLVVVEGGHVQGAHAVPVGEQPPRQVQAEEACAARDRDPHARATAWLPPASGRGGGAELTRSAAASRTASATDDSPSRLRRSVPGASPRASGGRTRKWCAAPQPSATVTTASLTSSSRP